MNFIDATSKIYRHPTRHGWLITQPMRAEVHHAGAAVRPTRDQIHEHKDGHVRVYRDGVLFCEAYGVLKREGRRAVRAALIASTSADARGAA